MSKGRARDRLPPVLQWKSGIVALAAVAMFFAGLPLEPVSSHMPHIASSCNEGVKSGGFGAPGKKTGRRRNFRRVKEIRYLPAPTRRRKGDSPIFVAPKIGTVPPYAPPCPETTRDMKNIPDEI